MRDQLLASSARAIVLNACSDQDAFETTQSRMAALEAENQQLRASIDTGAHHSTAH